MALPKPHVSAPPTVTHPGKPPAPSPSGSRESESTPTREGEADDQYPADPKGSVFADIGVELANQSIHYHAESLVKMLALPRKVIGEALARIAEQFTG